MAKTIERSPLFNKIITAREEAGLPVPESSLTPEQKRIVNSLKQAESGTKKETDGQIWMKA